MKQLWIVTILLILSACGSNALVDERFSSEREIPDTLQMENLIAGINDEADALRLIVADSITGSDGLMTITTDGALADYEISARVYIAQGETQLWARTDDEGCAGYILSIDPMNGRYRLSVVDENCDIQTLASEVPLEVPFNRWYDMRLQLDGTTIRGFVDGVEFFDIEDERYSTGLTRVRIVSRSVRAGQVDIERITIRPL